jgi:hypothetical protein
MRAARAKVFSSGCRKHAFIFRAKFKVHWRGARRAKSVRLSKQRAIAK